MADSSNFSRRAVLQTSAAAFGLGVTGLASADDGAVDSGDTVDTDGTLDGTASGDDPDGDDPFAGAEQVPPSDMTDSEEHLETVSPTAVPPEQSSGIGPGSMLFITSEDSSGTAGCTANFVWQDSGGTLYLGAAGHCFLPEGESADDNAGGSYDASQVTTRACVDCTFGGAVALSGAVRGQVVELGSVAYARQSDGGTQVGNDFGLVEIPSGAEDLVDPSMPAWGGPSATGDINGGDPVVQYGNGVAAGETFVTKGRTGVGVVNDQQTGSWVAELPAAPGDSGSGVQVAAQGDGGLAGEEAAGVLTHLVVGGTAGTNVAKAKEMAMEAGLDISVVLP